MAVKMEDDLTKQNQELAENEIEKIEEQNQQNEQQSQRSQVYKVCLVFGPFFEDLSKRREVST